MEKNTHRLQFESKFRPKVFALLASFGSKRYADDHVQASYEALQKAELGQESD